MTPLLFSLEADYPLADSLSSALGAEQGRFQRRRFPDGETYLRVEDAVAGRHCVIVASLVRPDERFLPLAFLASTLRELGASSVGLVAPYLCYMRQDRRFAEGEALTSRVFADLLSSQADWLVTVDPHLHRYHSLAELYSIPATAVEGAPAMARWLTERGEPCLLVGPDAESEQWVAAIAAASGQPFVVGSKQRRGDRDVSITLPELGEHRARTAVIIDDVIASGHTLLEALAALRRAGVERVDCAAVHGIFADGADRRLLDAGLRQLITGNGIPHASNAVDLAPLLVAPVQHYLTGQQREGVPLS